MTTFNGTCLVSTFCSNMNVDKFGLHIYKKRKNNYGFNIAPECVIKQIDAKNLDAQSKRLKNLGHPQDSCDAVTKDYVDKCITDLWNKVSTNIKLITEISNTLTKLEDHFQNSNKNEQKKRSK